MESNVKKYIYLFYFVLILLVIISCNKKEGYSYQGYKFITHTDRFEETHDLCLARYGINTNRTINTPEWDDIHDFEVTFYSLDHLNLKEARKKIVDCIEDYLTLINSNEKLKPHLFKHPFTQKELFFRISFYDKSGKRVNKKYISMCYLDDEMIYYCNTPKDDILITLHKESYSEALKKTKNKDTNSKLK